jgi:hypothetical protein
LIDDARSSGIIDRFFVVGSYVTEEAEPNDYDCLLFVNPSVTGKTLRPADYNVISSIMNRRIYRGDILAIRSDTPKATDTLKFFQQTREQKARGIVEILL